MFRPGSSRRVVVNVAEHGPAWGHLCQCMVTRKSPMSPACRPHPTHPHAEMRSSMAVGVGEGDVHDNGLLWSRHGVFLSQTSEISLMMHVDGWPFDDGVCAFVGVAGMGSSGQAAHRKAYDEALEAYRFQAFALAESALDRAFGKVGYVDAWQAQPIAIWIGTMWPKCCSALNLDGEKFHLDGLNWPKSIGKTAYTKGCHLAHPRWHGCR